MRKSFLLKINSIVISLLLSFILFAYPTYSYFFSYYPSRNGEGKIILVTGDSYAGYFATFECLKDYNYLIYADAGKTTKDNYDMMVEAINAFPDTIIISVGVNDHHKDIVPYDFGNRIEQLILLCKEKNKKVILHTFMDYDIEAFKDSKNIFEIGDYDKELKRLGEMYSNVFYIDMSDYNKVEYLQADKIHYNKVFYDELYNRISTALLLFS